MYESVVIDDLLGKVDTVARLQEAKKVTCVKIRLGALADLSSVNLHEYFSHDTQGTIADGAELEIEQLKDINDPRAHDVILADVVLAC